MAVCSNCGKELDGETMFCENCGTKASEDFGKPLQQHVLESKKSSENKNVAATENLQRESVAIKSLVLAAWLIVVLLVVGLITAWSLTKENKNKAKAKPDKQITLFEKWTKDSCSAMVEGTYIYGAETFCYNITVTNNTRNVGSVIMQSQENSSINVVLVEDMKQVGYRIDTDDDKKRGYTNCVKIDSVMFHRVMNDMTLTSSKKSSW